VLNENDDVENDTDSTFNKETLLIPAFDVPTPNKDANWRREPTANYHFHRCG
jgi:hypothetical protein